MRATARLPSPKTAIAQLRPAPSSGRLQQHPQSTQLAIAILQNLVFPIRIALATLQKIVGTPNASLLRLDPHLMPKTPENTSRHHPAAAEQESGKRSGTHYSAARSQSSNHGRNPLNRQYAWLPKITKGSQSRWVEPRNQAISTASKGDQQVCDVSAIQIILNFTPLGTG